MSFQGQEAELFHQADLAVSSPETKRKHASSRFLRSTRIFTKVHRI